MLDPRTQAVLQDVVRRESQSLLQYAGESFPWTTPGEEGALAELRRLVAEERAATAGLVKFLQRQRINLPLLGQYPASFTTINYVSLDHLLPLLLRHGQRALTALERDRQEIADPEARAQLDRILETKGRHVKALEALTAAHPETVTP